MPAAFRVAFAVVLLAALGLSTWAVLRTRTDIAALASRVAQIERRPAPRPSAPAPAGVAGTPASVSSPAPEPRGTAPSLPESSDVEALRHQVAELSARVHALSGHAAPNGVPSATGAPSGSTLPPPSVPTFDDPTRQAIKDLVRETIDEDPTSVGAITVSAPIPGPMGDIDALAKELGLSETQKAEVQKAWDEREKEMQSVWDGEGDFPEPGRMKEKMKELDGKTDERIKQVLTVEQARRYDEMKSERGNALFIGVRKKVESGGEKK